ncbi:hypothetical protein [Catenulispora pinisilvae]|uniref:hypothetical protein n=1 Tax=Catenulispora pinisilvae TaxID=2705253 RepID=UPI00189107A1|nr:hypothetical protein [Catenulispora pinisilvae]
MFVYHLVDPLDDFGGLTALPDWLRNATPDNTAWVLQAVLALQTAAKEIGWEGEMRHLPWVGILDVGREPQRYLVVKQDNNGETFLVSTDRLYWPENEIGEVHETVTPRIGVCHHPTFDDDLDDATGWPTR